jgi:hypothetical protein
VGVRSKAGEGGGEREKSFFFYVEFFSFLQKLSFTVEKESSSRFSTRRGSSFLFLLPFFKSMEHSTRLVARASLLVAIVALAAFAVPAKVGN